MSRYLVPASFFGATAWVSWYNGAHETSKILLPLVDVFFPASVDDPGQMGARSVQVLFGVSVVVLAFTVREHVRALRSPPAKG